MRKQTKVAAVVSAAALLAIGASMTSFAKGWTEIAKDEWVYLNSDDERVYGEWRKSVDGNYYWLDEEDGVMAKDRLIEDGDDTYYVNKYGVRIMNDWKEVPNEDGYYVGEEEPASVYYYFGSNGRAYKAPADKEYKKISIDGATYFFDEDGIMQYGWVKYDNKYYYCGTEDQGWSYKGWLFVETDTIPEIDDDDYDDEVWVYLDGGKLLTDTTKYIDKHYYSFNQFGVMEKYWHDSANAASAGFASGAEAYAYNEGVAAGVLADKWVEADYKDNGELKWYYMVTIRGEKTARAIPFNKGTGKMAAKLIDGKTYLFNEDGQMQTGLKKNIQTDADGFKGISSKALANGTYYFATSSEGGVKKGQMMTGKITHIDDGEEYNYYFGKDGKALTKTMKDNVIYDEFGVRMQAEDGNAYEIIWDIEYDIKDEKGNLVIEKGSDFVVSSTGKVRTSKTITIDGEKYDITTSKNGGQWKVEPSKDNK